MSVDECIESYKSLVKRVFKKNGHRVNWRGYVKSRFNTEELERAIKQLLKDRGHDPEMLLKDSLEAKCKV